MKGWFLLPVGLLACEPMPSSGDVLAAVSPHPSTEEASGEAEDVATREDRVPGEPDPELEAASAEPARALDAHLLEITGGPEEETDPEAAPDDEALSAATFEVPKRSTASNPSAWGPRVLTTLSSLEPPRAVLALPDGSERVVRPGTMLPEIGGVVVAIGRDVVELSEVREEGVYASIHTRTIPALIPESDEP